MATFLTTHSSPGLSAEEIANVAPDVADSKYATFRNLYVNMLTGFIVSIYEADDQDALEREMERVGFTFDQIHEIHYALDAAGLQAMIQSSPAS